MVCSRQEPRAASATFADNANLRSRLVVRNLPQSLTSSDLRTYFSSHGQATVTDARVLHKKDGTSRRLGFVGFATPAQAAQALAYFNGALLSGCRITVDAAEQVSGTDS